MRRTSIAAVLICALALPLSAQRYRTSSPHAGGSVSFRSGRGSFGSHAGVAFRGGPVLHSGSGFRGGGFGIRGGVSFGRNPRFNVFVNSRPFGRPRRWSVYPYRYAPSYVYPYVVYPAYPLSYYDAYDYTPVPMTSSYAYEYGSGDAGYYPAEPGLAEQMRQQGVGIYAQPAPTAPQPQSVAPAQPERQLTSTVLVYRDGRRAEVHNYAIVGQTLWIFSEQRSQKVPLEQLDLEATRKANDERGVDFVVPR